MVEKRGDTCQREEEKRRAEHSGSAESVFVRV